MPKLR